MAEIILDPLGETVEEGTIVRWHKRPGDMVVVDEPLFEVETDKVTADVPSTLTGEMVEILVEEGSTVPIGTVLAVVRLDGEELLTVRPGDQRDDAGEAASSLPLTQPPAVAAPEPTEARDRQNSRSPGTGDSRVRSPLVRRLINENRLDAAELPGSGSGGRITRGDVLKYLESRSAPNPEEEPTSPTAAVEEQSPPDAAASTDDEFERMPFTSVRRITAEHMVRSKATSAHTLTIVQVDYERVAQVRESVAPAFKEAEGFSLTYLPFIMRAVIDGLQEFPRVNASVVDDALHVYRRVHLGIAVALGVDGLVVPVIRDAASLRLPALARTVNDLSSRARSKQLRPDDLHGGTFTITNPGGYGTLAGAAIINQPQVAIVNTDGIAKAPVVIERPGEPDSLAIHRVGNLSMSWDHRAVDGAYAAAFLDSVRNDLETRDWHQEL